MNSQERKVIVTGGDEHYLWGEIHLPAAVTPSGNMLEAVSRLDAKLGYYCKYRCVYFLFSKFLGCSIEYKGPSKGHNFIYDPIGEKDWKYPIYLDKEHFEIEMARKEDQDEKIPHWTQRYSAVAYDIQHKELLVHYYQYTSLPKEGVIRNIMNKQLEGHSMDYSIVIYKAGPGRWNYKGFTVETYE